MTNQVTKRIVRWTAVFFVILLLFCMCNAINGCAAVEGHKAKVTEYRDGRPAAKLRMEAEDFGVVLRYGYIAVARML